MKKKMLGLLVCLTVLPLAIVFSACAAKTKNVDVYLPLSFVNNPPYNSSWKCNINDKDIYLKFNTAGTVAYYETSPKAVGVFSHSLDYSVSGDKMTWVYGAAAIVGFDEFLINYWGVPASSITIPDKVGALRRVTFNIKRIDETHLKIETNIFTAEFDE